MTKISPKTIQAIRVLPVIVGLLLPICILGCKDDITKASITQSANAPSENNDPVKQNQFEGDLMRVIDARKLEIQRNDFYETTPSFESFVENKGNTVIEFVVIVAYSGGNYAIERTIAGRIPSDYDLLMTILNADSIPHQRFLVGRVMPKGGWGAGLDRGEGRQLFCWRLRENVFDYGFENEKSMTLQEFESLLDP